MENNNMKRKIIDSYDCNDEHIYVMLSKYIVQKFIGVLLT